MNQKSVKPLSVEDGTEIATEPYIVVANGDNACAHCNGGTLWDILYVPEDVRMSTSYGNQENAEDICEGLNSAFENGAQCNKDAINLLLGVLKAYQALDDQRMACKECEDCLERAPEACPYCFPFADDARLRMRAAIARMEAIS
jgi:hypothetical protein